MATLRIILECNDCSHLYRVRYGYGNNFPQKVSFHCDNCSNSIEVGFKKIGEQFFNGAKKAEGGLSLDDGTLTVKNLHPEIAISKEDENNPLHFQTLEVFSKLNRNKIDFSKFQEEQALLHRFFKQWQEIEKKLRILSAKGEYKLLQVYNTNLKKFSLEFTEWGLYYLSGKKLDYAESFLDEFEENVDRDFINYIKTESHLFKKIYTFCKGFMNNADQLQAPIFDLKLGLEIDEESHVNVNWDEISKVYGDMYEVLGDLFVIPTMINNLKSGRKYDEFISEGFDLRKYFETDKANRGRNFEDNENFKFLLDYYFAWLRNGTHHNNSTLDSERNEIELGVGKGGGTPRKVRLIEYVRYCNEIFIAGLIISLLIFKLKTHE